MTRGFRRARSKKSCVVSSIDHSQGLIKDSHKAATYVNIRRTRGNALEEFYFHTYKTCM